MLRPLPPFPGQPPCRRRDRAVAGGAVRLLLVALFSLTSPDRSALAQIPGAVEPFDNRAELYHRANRYFTYGTDAKDVSDKRRAFELAIPLYREFLATKPEGELAQQGSYELGMALLMTGERQGAERTFQSIIRRYQTGNWVALAAYRQAAQLYNRQDWLDAAPYFAITTKQATDKSLGHKSIFYESRCLKLAGKSQEAIRRLEEIVGDPQNPFREYARLAIGELLAEEGKHEDALEQFEILLAPNTAPQERAQALLAAGVSASKLGQKAKAIEFLEEAIDTPGIDPKYQAKAQLALMEIRFEEEDHNETVAVFRRGEFLGEREDMARIYMMAGQSLAKLNRHSQAIRQFFSAERLAVSVKNDPMMKLAFEASYRRLSSFYQINGANIPTQVDAFVKIYGESHPASPWLHKARLMKAEILFHQGSLSQAAAAYNDVNPSALPEEMRADVYFKRGWCLGDSGEYGRAAQNLSSFIASYPDHPMINEALAKRGQAYVNIGDRESALKDFQTLLEADPEPNLASFAHQHAGRIHHDEGRWQAMITSYQSLLAVPGNLDYKSRAEANYWIGLGWFEQEEFAKAIPAFETARNLLPQRYREPAGVHLVLAAYSMLDSDKLKECAERLMTDAPHQRLPNRMLIWLGLERFSKEDYDGAKRFLTLATTPDDPAQTDVIVWRHLAKAHLETQSFQVALETLDILLTLDQEDFWKADTQLDRSQVLIGMDKRDEAREAAMEGLALDPQGTVRAGLYMSLADIAMHRQDYESAADSYLRTAEMFIDDKEIKPQALSRAAEALEKSGKQEAAAGIRKKLQQEFPTWTSAKN